MPKYLIMNDKIHRPTCKRALAAEGVKERNLTTPGGRDLAGCCKPTFLADTSKPATPAKAAAAKKVPAAKKAAIPRAAAKKAAPAKKATRAKKAPAKSTTAKRAPAAKAPEIPDVANAREAVAAGADPHPIRRAELGEAESKARRRARSEGDEDLPGTPNADFVAKEYAGGIDHARRKEMAREYEAAIRGVTPSSGKRGRPAPSVNYFRGGKAMPASQNRFSSLAYWYTRDVGRERPRMPAAELRQLVQAECKVTDVEQEAWKITLSNGETIEARKLQLGAGDR